MRLGGILDDDETTPAADLHNRIHVGRVPKQMDRHDGSRPCGDYGLDLGDIEGIGDRIYIDKHRYRAHIPNGRDAGDKREGRRDDLVARAYSGSEETEV